MTARFIQVDLEIESEHSLALICEEFAKSNVFELHHSRTERGYFLAFEFDGSGLSEDGEATDDPADLIAGFCTLIGQLSPQARVLWDGAFRRTFDIGYQSTGGSARLSSGLSASTLAAMAELGASLGITLYPPAPEAPVVVL